MVSHNEAFMNDGVVQSKNAGLPILVQRWGNFNKNNCNSSTNNNLNKIEFNKESSKATRSQASEFIRLSELCIANGIKPENEMILKNSNRRAIGLAIRRMSFALHKAGVDYTNADIEVRCKDCKFFMATTGEFGKCIKTSKLYKARQYCVNGEKKGE